MDINSLLKKMVEARASDLFLNEGMISCIRVDGKLKPFGKEAINSATLIEIVKIFIGEDGFNEFQSAKEMDVAYHSKGTGRFRINLFYQSDMIALAIRYVNDSKLSFKDLNLPVETMQKLSSEERGLILITGPAGSGKSTTLAAIINEINAKKNKHVITIEDPIEFVHDNNNSLINQRQVGTDTESFHNSLRCVMRQSADVILIGEMRDMETISAALTAAEMGALVLSTLHTNDAPQTVDRIINFFPPHQHHQIRTQLSFVLKGVVSQRLIPLASGKGLIPAISIMVQTPTVKKLILEAKTGSLKDAIAGGEIYGMQTFNQVLAKLYKEKKITFEEALTACENPNEFKLVVSGIKEG